MDPEAIYHRAYHPSFAGTSPEPATHLAIGANPSCGDEVSFALVVNQGSIQYARHTCRACAICTAAADLVCEYLEEGHINIRDVPTLPNEVVLDMLAIPLSPTRMVCATLPLSTLRNNLEETQV
jgi:NifU-like protein involved in Fe-S cluster formation